jgi:hypothetical protein
VLKITAKIHIAKLVPLTLQLAAEIDHAVSMHSCGFQFAKNRVLHQPMKANGFFETPVHIDDKGQTFSRVDEQGVRARTVV